MKSKGKSKGAKAKAFDNEKTELAVITPEITFDANGKFISQQPLKEISHEMTKRELRKLQRTEYQQGLIDVNNAQFGAYFHPRTKQALSGLGNTKTVSRNDNKGGLLMKPQKAKKYIKGMASSYNRQGQRYVSE